MRPLGHSTYVDVEASNAHEAERMALEEARDNPGHFEWTLDEGTFRSGHLAAAGLAGRPAVPRSLMRILICALALRGQLRPLRRTSDRGGSGRSSCSNSR